MTYQQFFPTLREANEQAGRMRRSGWPGARVVKATQLDPGYADLDPTDDPPYLIQVQQGVFLLDDGSVGQPPAA